MHESFLSVDIVNLEKRKEVTDRQNQLIKEDILVLEKMIHRLSKTHRSQPENVEESTRPSYQQNDIAPVASESSIEIRDRPAIEERKSLAQELGMITEETSTSSSNSNEDIKFEKDCFKHKLYSNLRKQYSDYLENEMDNPSAFVQC